MIGQTDNQTDRSEVGSEQAEKTEKRTKYGFQFSEPCLRNQATGQTTADNQTDKPDKT